MINAQAVCTIANILNGSIISGAFCMAKARLVKRPTATSVTSFGLLRTVSIIKSQAERESAFKGSVSGKSISPRPFWHLQKWLVHQQVPLMGYQQTATYLQH